MKTMQWLKENWLQPFFFFGNNLLSLIGGAITTASAFVLVGFWIVSIFGHSGSANPYIGIGVSCTLWNDHTVFAETQIQTPPDEAASKA